MKFKKLKILLLSIIFTMVLSGCSTGNSFTTQKPSDDNEKHPLVDQSTGYPVSDTINENGYPILDETSTPKQGPDFNLSKPIISNDTIVTGSGPAGVPINLVDVSELGVVLAETVIKSDGTFTFNLEMSLPAKHMVGLMLGDLTGTNLDPNDYIHNDTYYVRPMIGILFDIAPVE